MRQKALLLLLIPIFIFASELVYIECEDKGHIFKEEELFEALSLDTPSWYQFWKDRRPKINRKYASTLDDILLNFYKSQGFYHAKVDVKEDNSTHTIKFVVTPNKPVIITDISIDMPQKYQKYIALKKGGRFIATKFIETKKKIKQELGIEGYCSANFVTKAIVDLEKNIATLKYRLKKGDPCTFSKINIFSPKDIDKKVIYSRLNFIEGSRYSTRRIRDAYSSISGLEVFNSIEFKESKSNNKVDLSISTTKRKRFIRQEIGVGYETNLGPKAIFRWEQRNFHGNAKKIAFDTKYSNKEKFIKNSFFVPAFMRVPRFEKYYLDFKNEFSYSKIEFDKFNEEKLSNYLHLLKDYYRFSVDGGIGLERIKIVKSGEICNVSDGEFFLLFPFIKLIVDTRDSKIDPKEGIYLSGYLESGLKALASVTSYSKMIFEARAIQSYDNLTVALKGKLGVVSEFVKSLPESKRFFAGGAFSNRAYGYHRLGATDSSCEDMGGKTLIDTSVEADYKINEKFSVAAFWDSTLITEKSFKFDTDFVNGVGIGIRYLTPIGPAKIDYGIDINNHSQHAIHFLIGQSF